MAQQGFDWAEPPCPRLTQWPPTLAPLSSDWKGVVQAFLDSDHGQALCARMTNALDAGAVVYPPQPFRALELTPLQDVRVVVLGQDPYHGPGQAHGLSFSVKRPVRPPPSLVNIYKELQADLGVAPPEHGELTAWADQGVLLLNAVLTVRAREPNSHRGHGWERFTDRVVEVLATRREGLVFLLWGAAAAQKAQGLDPGRHLVLKSPHPSPYSANSGFFGSRPFSRINRWFEARGEPPIDWRIP